MAPLIAVAGPPREQRAEQLEPVDDVLTGGVHHTATVRADPEAFDVSAGDERAVQLRRRSAEDRHAVQLEDVVGVLVGAEHDTVVVGNCRTEGVDIAICGEWRVQPGNDPADDRHAEQLEHVIGQLIGGVHHSGAIGAEQ